MHVCTYVYIGIYMHVYVCIHVFIHACVCVCVCVCEKTECFRLWFLYLTSASWNVVPETQNTSPTVNYLIDGRAGVRTSLSCPLDW